jgi:ribosomal protein S18 acetylase RimI-like enzyme
MKSLEALHESQEEESREAEFLGAPFQRIELREAAFAADPACADAPACHPVGLRSVCPDDDAFIFGVYASTRARELQLTGWDSAQQNTFLQMQFQAQKDSYRLQFPNADHWVIQCDETAVGRMILDRTGLELLLIDIALLPEFRNLRIGSLLMAGILEEAARAGKAVRLHVEVFNSALLWYRRLGFSAVREDAVYVEMLWKP